MKKKVVYTAVMGTSEHLQELSFAPEHPDIDFICFTDQPDIRSQTWQVKLVNPRVPKDPVRSARYLKLVGHEALSGYQKWLWIDNRVSLTGPPHQIFEEDMRGKSVAISPHDHRQNVREEFLAVLKFRKDHSFAVRTFWKYLSITNPDLLNEKLFQNTIILRENTPEVTRFMEKWWELILRFSARDQLSLNLVVRETGMQLHPLPFQISGSAHHSYTPRSDVLKSPQKSPSFYPGLWQQLLDILLFNAIRAKVEPRLRLFHGLVLRRD